MILESNVRHIDLAYTNPELILKRIHAAASNCFLESLRIALPWGFLLFCLACHNSPLLRSLLS